MPLLQLPDVFSYFSELPLLCKDVFLEARKVQWQLCVFIRVKPKFFCCFIKIRYAKLLLVEHQTLVAQSHSWCHARSRQSRQLLVHVETDGFCKHLLQYKIGLIFLYGQLA